MKAAVIALLVATASAMRLTTPDESYAAKAASLQTSLDTVAAQQKFAADHLAKHTANMDQADSECSPLKAHVRKARADQVAGGNQYPPLKTYVAAKEWRASLDTRLWWSLSTQSANTHSTCTQWNREEK